MCAKISWFLHTIFSPRTYAMVSGIPIALKDNKAKYKCQQIVARMLFICMNFDEKRPLRMSVVNISLLSNHIRCNIKSESYLELSRICVALYWIFNFQWHCSWGRPTSIQNEDAKCQCQRWDYPLKITFVRSKWLRLSEHKLVHAVFCSCQFDCIDRSNAHALNIT